jgi:hypothetical protein
MKMTSKMKKCNTKSIYPPTEQEETAVERSDEKGMF